MGHDNASDGRPRILRDVLIGVCLGGIAAALVWQLYPGFWKEPPIEAHEVALQRRHALQQEAERQAAHARLAAVRPAPAPTPCNLEPLIPPSSAQDGRASVEHPFPGGPREKARVFLRQADAAAAQGRLRDAEVGLLAACRENGIASARPTVPLARVLGVLGERYAAAAGAEDAPVLREQLLARARHFVGLSAQAYATALGPNASRSRMARERLASLQEDLVTAADVPQARAEPLRAEPLPPRQLPAKVRVVRNAPPATTVAARRGSSEDPKPVQDRARLEAPPELRQLAADLARLRAQAEAVSEDPVGFRRRAELAQAQRERCQDAACLRDWYGKRRRELLAEF